MQLKDYIRGDRRGKEANRLEREAMNDPFLQDALEGFDAVEGDHVSIIENLERTHLERTHFKTLHQRPSRHSRKFFLYGSAAATILLLIGFGVYFSLVNIVPDSALVMLQSNEYEEIKIVSESTESEPAPASKPESETVITTLEAVKATRQTLPSQPETVSQSQVLSVHPENNNKSQTLPVQIETTMQPPANIVQVETPPIENNDEDIMKQATGLADHEIAVSPSIAASKQKNDTSPASPVLRRSRTTRNSESDTEQIIFGEKEFQAYCRKMADKDMCNGKSISVKVSFYINANGKPTNIKFKRYSCEKAKEEIENLLSSSPVWTITNRKVTMTIRW